MINILIGIIVMVAIISLFIGVMWALGTIGKKFLGYGGIVDNAMMVIMMIVILIVFMRLSYFIGEEICRVLSALSI